MNNFDDKIAQQILGKYILVGITYLDSNGELESQSQLHGRVKKVSETEGILIDLRGVHEGEEWNMLPNTMLLPRLIKVYTNSGAQVNK